SCSSPLGRGIREGLSTLTIENGTELDAFVKVFKVSGGRLLIRNLFIVAGKTCTSDSVPAGEYVLLTAFGKDWDASTKKFNFRRSFAEAQRFEVTEEQVGLTTQYSRITVTLHKVLNGNFESHDISEADFEHQ